MHANDLKQPLDFLEDLDNTTALFNAGAWLRQTNANAAHYQKLLDQGFPIPEHAYRLLLPPGQNAPVVENVEPTPPKDPIDENDIARELVEQLRAFLRLPAVGKSFATQSPQAMSAKGEAMKMLLYGLVELAAEEGVIVTIEQKPYPNGKLRMGHSMTAIETRWERPIYQHFMKLNDPEKFKLKTVDELNRELGRMIKRLNGPEAAPEGLYCDLGWCVNGRQINTPEQLAEKIYRTAVSHDLALFHEVPPPPKAEVIRTDAGPLTYVPGDTYMAPAAPHTPTQYEMLEAIREHAKTDPATAEALQEITDRATAVLANTVGIIQKHSKDQEDHFAGMPLGVIDELPPAVNPCEVTPAMLAAVPPAVVDTVLKLAERGTPLATKLVEGFAWPTAQAEPKPEAAPLPTYEPDTFQYRVMEWCEEAFEPLNMDVLDLMERALRLQEEATEASQSVGISADLVNQITAQVYAKAPGELKQEIAGTLMCLAALAEAANIDMLQAGEEELARVWTAIPQIQEKNLKKVRSTGTPLVFKVYDEGVEMAAEIARKVNTRADIYFPALGGIVRDVEVRVMPEGPLADDPPIAMGHPYAPYPRPNKHIGSTFDSFLEEEGTLGEVTLAARKRIEEPIDTSMYQQAYAIPVSFKPDGSLDFMSV